MIFAAMPRRLAKPVPDIRSGTLQARTLSARARLARRPRPRLHQPVRPAKQRVQPWRFWWGGPAHLA